MNPNPAGGGYDRGGDCWVFDVDGCLVDSVTGSSVRPLAAELLQLVRNHALAVVIWSAGGAAYAARKAQSVGLHDLANAYYSKDVRRPDGRWSTATVRARHRPCVFVDDQADELPADDPVISVRPYLGHRPSDRSFQPLIELLGAPSTTSGDPPPSKEGEPVAEVQRSAGQGPTDHAGPTA